MSEDQSQANGSESNIDQSNNAEKKQVTFNEHGQPILYGSEKFCTFIGRTSKTHCSPAYISWKKVPNTIKDEIWKAIIVEYDVHEMYKKKVLHIANTAWKHWKYEIHVYYDKFSTDMERKRAQNLPKCIEKEDWEKFVDMCSMEEDRICREKGKCSRKFMKRPHTTGRTGLARIAEELKKKDGINNIRRSRLFVAGHISKKKEISPFMNQQLEEIQRLVANDPSLAEKDLDHDVVALVCSPDGRGRIRGMGSGISKTAFHASAPSREIVRREKGELDTLKTTFAKQLEEHKILQEHVATLMQERQESSESLNSQVRRSSDSGINLPSICLVKNLRRKVVAMGRVNRDVAYCEETYNIILDGIYEENENLYDKDEKFGDIMIGDMINWPKNFVELVSI